MVIRPAEAADSAAWLTLWRGYCEALGGKIPDDVSRGVWGRIMAEDHPIWCLMACDDGGKSLRNLLSIPQVASSKDFRATTRWRDAKLLLDSARQLRKIADWFEQEVDDATLLTPRRALGR